MPRTLLRAVTRFAAVSLVLAGCSSSPDFRGAEAAPPARPGLAVVVENHAWEDVAVYASSGMARRRLGSVTAGRTGSFRLDGLVASATDLELVAQAMAASRVHRSGRLMVYAGQTVTWTLHQGRLGGDVTIR